MNLLRLWLVPAIVALIGLHGRLDLLRTPTDPSSILARLDALEARVAALERRP